MRMRQTARKEPSLTCALLLSHGSHGHALPSCQTQLDVNLPGRPSSLLLSLAMTKRIYSSPLSPSVMLSTLPSPRQHR